MGRIARDEAAQQLAALMAEFPDNEAVVVNFASMARKRHEASTLREAYVRVEDSLTAIQRAFVEYRITSLEGDNEGAGAAANRWFSLEPENPMAAAAALLAVGIGLSRWSEAAVIAEYALKQFPGDEAVINNAAYVLAMAGRPEVAIRVLKPIAENMYVFQSDPRASFLGVRGHCAGMRLYREAAEEAEREDPPSRILMALYQALVVRQLNLEADKARPTRMIEASALIPVALPDDWQDRPEYLLLNAVCTQKGYDWPPTL